MIVLVFIILSVGTFLTALLLLVLVYVAVAQWREHRAQLVALKNAVETQNYYIRDIDDYTEGTLLKITMPQLHGERIIKICPEGKIRTPMWWFGSNVPPRQSGVPSKRWCKEAEKYTGQMAVMYKLSKNNAE